MTGNDANLIADAMNVLRENGHHITETSDQFSHRAGLYAVHAESSIWRFLGLEDHEGPLYVGKDERSLVSRDIKTHFATGKTGASTVRRSFAALLRQPLNLRAVPRNTATPGYFANYAVEPAGDARLTEWMRENLTLAVWEKPEGVPLRPLEIGVLSGWMPPLNLTDVPRPWPHLKAARKVMADEARAWAPGAGVARS